MGWLARSLAQMLAGYLTKGCRHPRALPGIITVPQTFGEKLNPSPHFHVLATIPPRGIDPETGGYHDPQGRGSVGGATEGKESTDPLQCPECGEQMRQVRLVGPGSAREKYQQLRPSLLYWGERGVIRREPRSPGRGKCRGRGRRPHRRDLSRPP